MVNINPTIKISTLNVNEHIESTTCCRKEKHLRFQDANRLKAKGWKNNIPCKQHLQKIYSGYQYQTTQTSKPEIVLEAKKDIS